MIIVVVTFWITVFSIRAMMSRNGKTIIESLSSILLLVSFYTFYRLKDDHLTYFVPLLMMFSLLIGTYFLGNRTRGNE